MIRTEREARVWTVEDVREAVEEGFKLCERWFVVVWSSVGRAEEEEEEVEGKR